MAKKAATTRPTSLAYGCFEQAHQFFNRELFGGTLPPALLTLTRNPRAYGYFSGARFMRAHGDDDGKHVDEIAMNPMLFAERSIDKTLSTFVHEMVHQWQHHHGKEPTRCYHDRQWAAKMKEVGLYPSSTAAPGGKEVGSQVSHYIIERGPFATACAKFSKAHETVLYQDRARIIALAKSKGKGGEEGEEGEGGEEKPKKSKGRAKFQCKGCELNAWAKPGAKLRCDDCDRPLHLCEEENDNADAD